MYNIIIHMHILLNKLMPVYLRKLLWLELPLTAPTKFDHSFTIVQDVVYHANLIWLLGEVTTSIKRGNNHDHSPIYFTRSLSEWPKIIINIVVWHLMESKCWIWPMACSSANRMDPVKKMEKTWNYSWCPTSMNVEELSRAPAICHTMWPFSWLE